MYVVYICIYMYVTDICICLTRYSIVDLSYSRLNGKVLFLLLHFQADYESLISELLCFEVKKRR